MSRIAVLRSILFAMSIVALSACGSANSSSPVPHELAPAAPNAVASPSVRSRNGEVFITLPPIAAGTPAPNQPALSSATHSIGGTIGRAILGPIALSSASSQCSPSPAGLQCTVSMQVPVGTHRIAVSTFATTDGTGKALATATGSVRVRYDAQSYAAPMTWTAIVRKLAVVQTTPPLVQGRAATASFTIDGLDAGNAIAPNASLTDPLGNQISIVSVYFSGPYLQNANIPLGTAATLAYDGALAGTERVLASVPGNPVRPAHAAFTITPGATGNAQIFAQAPNLVAPAGTPNLFQFASGASGDVAPIRTLSTSARLAAVADDGSYWAVYAFGTQYAFFNHYDANGNVLDTIPSTYPGSSPSNAPRIAAATVDAAGNAYVVAYLPQQIPVLSVYPPGGYHSSPARSIAIGTATWGYYAYVNPQIAVDAGGDIFIGYTACADTCWHGSESIFEYAAGASGAAAPARTIAVNWLSGLGVDSSGIVYTVEQSSNVGTELNKYALDGTKTTIASAQLSGATPEGSILGLAIDGQSNLYTSWIVQAVGSDPGQAEINIYPPGATVPSRTIAGSATGFTSDEEFTSIAVAP